MKRRILAALLGALLMGGLGVVAAGPAAAAGLACNAHDKFRASGSNTPTVHVFFYYGCNVDPASAGATSIDEEMDIVKVDGSAGALESVSRGTAGAAATERTLCSHSGCSISNFPPGRYQAFESLTIHGNVANADAHCHRGTGLPGDPIFCPFEGPVFNLT